MPPCVRGSRSSNHESRIPAVPALPCAGGLPPQRPSMLCHRACAIPADVSTSVVPVPPYLRGSRSSNHESRIPAVQGGRAVPALPSAGGFPPQRPPVAMPPCVPVPKLVCQRPVGNATVRARNQLVCQSQREYVTVSARFQLAANAPRTPRHHACAAPAVRITNHKSLPFLVIPPCLHDSSLSSPPARPCQRVCILPATPFEFRRFEFRVSAVPGP